MRGLQLALLVALGSVAPPASALLGSSPPTLDLVYLRGGDASGCMAEPELRGRISAELGYDPFAAQDPARRRETLRIQLGHQRGILVADLELIGSDGRSLAQQHLRSRDPSCAALGAALEVAVSVMFDRVEELPKIVPRKGELFALSPIPEISLPPQPPPPKPPVHLLAGLLVAFAADLRPELVLQLSVRDTSWSLDLEGRYEYIAAADLVGHRESATLAPCVWSGAGGGIGFCPVLMGGVLQISGANGQGGSLPELATGARIAVAAPLWGPISLRLQGGVVFPLLSESTIVNGMTVTEPLVMTLDFGAGLSVQIL